jgi:uncharacterized membrane protein YphA (DoxX/SURF4 family)
VVFARFVTSSLSRGCKRGPERYERGLRFLPALHGRRIRLTWRHDAGVAYAILRLTFGVDFLTHGAPRIVHLAAFVAMTVGDFRGTFLPAWSVAAFATAIPFIEVAAGLLLVTGLRLRIVLPLLGIFLLTLVFGTTLRGRYDIVAEQLAYVLITAILTAARSFDLFSLDARFGVDRSQP